MGCKCDVVDRGNEELEFLLGYGIYFFFFDS